MVNMARKKIYVGKIFDSETRVIFRCAFTPTKETHNLYGWVIGPFRTVRAAEWYVMHPFAQCTTISEYERAALLYKGQSELIAGYRKHLDKVNS